MGRKTDAVVWRVTGEVKRSVTIAGHRTSVSLEAPFWDGLRVIAKARGQSINKLITEIDAGRTPDTGLSSALRLHVLRYYQDQGVVPAGADSSSGNSDS